MQKYGLHGKLTAKAGNADKLTEILLQASKLVSNAKGCQLYLVGKDDFEPNIVWITEVWDSKEDHANSLKVEGVKELISQAIPILAAPPSKGQEFVIVGGAGISE